MGDISSVTTYEGYMHEQIFTPAVEEDKFTFVWTEEEIEDDVRSDMIVMF